MPTQFSCVKGHNWQADGNGAAAHLCPLCGAPGAPTADTPPPQETIAWAVKNAPPLDPQQTVWNDLASDPVVFDSDPELELPPEPPGAEAAADSKLEGLTASAAAFRPTIPGYEIFDQLGRGGMGVVYKALQVRLKRYVALKMILSGPHADSVELERFVTEAEAAARLQHANIVQIHEIGEHEGRPYIALEYVEGGSLEDRIDGKPQPSRPSARLVEALARAMHYAHERGIVHRDLKPANILLQKSEIRNPKSETNPKPQIRNPKGRGFRFGISDLAFQISDFEPKITDFGLAKRLDADGGQTRTGSILGTPNYMSPEQATGQVHAVGPASDIYAMGAILYELLTGRPPFQGESAYDTLRRVATAEPLPPRSLVAGLPRDIETICLKCLHKDPHRRYTDALELARDLRRFQDRESIQARPTPAWERAVKWTRRRPGAAALLAAGIVGLVAATAGGLAWNAQLRLEAEREVARRTEVEDALKESRQRLVRLTVANGTRLLDDGDLIGSLPWFAEAMRLEAKDSHREGMHRLRLAAVLEQCPQLAQVWFHAARVNAIAFCPDGRQLVTASDDGTARIWDVATGMPTSRTPRHSKAVLHAAFSPDGAYIATAGADGTACLWRSDSGMSIGEPMKHAGAVVAVAFRHDGRRLLTGCKDGTARLWDVPTLEALSVVRHAAPLTQALFSPDGTRLLTAAEDGSVQVWSAEAGLPLARPVRQRGSVLSIAFSPDGRQFVTASAEGSARAWHTDSGLPATPPMRHNGGALHASFSPDGRLIATSGADQTARVWNAANGRAIGAPFRHGSKVFTAVFGPAARRLLTVSDDNTARVWDATSGAPLGPPLKHNGSVVCGAFSPDGRWAATGGQDGMVRLWSATSAQQHVPLLRHNGRVTDAAFSNTGRYLATASDDRTARVWNVENGEAVTLPLHHSGIVQRVAFSRDERLLLTAGQDGAARLWHTQGGEPAGQPFVHGHPLHDAAWRPDGGRIVTAGEDGTARIWDAAAGTSPVGPLLHPGPVRAVAFSPDGRQLLTACDDGAARLWNADSGEMLREFKHGGAVNHAAFNADGTRIVTASADHTARVWNAATGEPITPPLRHGSPVLHVAFNPRGECVVTAADDNTARVWNADSGEALTPPLRHMGTVRRAVFSPGGELVATASEDGTARIWDAKTGEPITPLLKHRGPATAVAFDPHGTHLVTCGPFAARLWRLARDERPVDELVRAAQVLAVGRIDDTGGLVALDMDAVRDAWREVRRQRADLVAPANSDVMGWHRREVEECEMCGDWYGAAWHLERLLAARPSDARLLRLRGEARAGAGDWQRALSDYTQAIENARNDWEAHLHRGLAHAQLREWPQAAADFAKNRDLGPDDPRVWHFYALTQLAADNMPAYREKCADLLKRFGSAADVETVRQVVWTAVLGPKAVPDAERLVAEAERALKGRPRHPLYLLTHGAALLRAGKLWEAAEQLQAALADGGDHAAHALLLLTLTYQQTRKIDEAKPWFDRALEALDDTAKEREEPNAWDRRLELEILRGEAERIFKQGKP